MAKTVLAGLHGDICELYIDEEFHGKLQEI
jgi:hypothetical protein